MAGTASVLSLNVFVPKKSESVDHLSSSNPSLSRKLLFIIKQFMQVQAPQCFFSSQVQTEVRLVNIRTSELKVNLKFIEIFSSVLHSLPW